MMGMTFGKLTVIGGPMRDKRTYWMCRCECGTEKKIRQDHLKSGCVVSCGCFRKEQICESSRTHGMSNTRIYRIWKGMLNRCRNQNIPQYRNWGGRGITVCDEWLEFTPFYEWSMSNGYTDNLTLDRKDNDGNYCPDNCRWTTRREQSLNRSSNSLITHGGVTKHISEWDKEIGSKKSGRVRARLNAGWSIADAVTTRV